MSTPVSTISSMLAANNDSTTKKTTGSSLDVDDFLKLLVAQMENQDPMSGDSSGGGSSSNTDYITQLAQFSMLQQLSSLNTDFTASKAYGLIGKYVYLQDSSSDSKPNSDLILGKVDGVTSKDGTYYLIVGGKEYDLADVQAVVNDTSDTDQNILNSADLIGKLVTASVTGSDGTATTVSGTVDKVNIQDGLVYVTINGQSIPLSDITEISGTDSTTDSTQSA